MIITYLVRLALKIDTECHVSHEVTHHTLPHLYPVVILNALIAAVGFGIFSRWYFRRDWRAITMFNLLSLGLVVGNFHDFLCGHISWFVRWGLLIGCAARTIASAP